MSKFILYCDGTKLLVKTSFFHEYFLNTGIPVTKESILTKFGPSVDNICMEGTVSQNFDMCLIFYFMPKNGKLFDIF